MADLIKYKINIDEMILEYPHITTRISNNNFARAL